MTRACLFALSCWVVAGAFGLSADDTARPLAQHASADRCLAGIDHHHTQVVETNPLTVAAAADRAPTGTSRPPSQRLGLLRDALLIRTHASRSCPHDTRVASRTGTVARRVVDLRREIFRTRPSRRVGGVEAAPALSA